MAITKKEAIKQAIEALKQEQKNGDIEGAHSNADDILCQLLNLIGCKEVVEEFEKVDKWYA